MPLFAIIFIDYYITPLLILHIIDYATLLMPLMIFHYCHYYIAITFTPCHYASAIASHDDIDY
jgi:hypothetical protein